MPSSTSMMPQNDSVESIFLSLSGLISSGIFISTGCILNILNVFGLLTHLPASSTFEFNKVPTQVAAERALISLRAEFSIFFTILQVTTGLLVLTVGLLGLLISVMFLSKRTILVSLVLTSILVILSLMCVIIGILETKQDWEAPSLSVPRFAKILIHFFDMLCAVSLCVTLARRVQRFRSNLVCRYDSFKLPLMIMGAVLITSSIASISAFSAGVLITKMNLGLAGGMHTGFLAFTTGLLILLNQRLMLNQDTTICCILFCAFSMVSSVISTYSESRELKLQKTDDAMFYPKVCKSATIYFAALLNLCILGPLLFCLVLRLWQISLICMHQTVAAVTTEQSGILQDNPLRYELLNINYMDSPQATQQKLQQHQQQETSTEKEVAPPYLSLDGANELTLRRPNGTQTLPLPKRRHPAKSNHDSRELQV